MNRVDFFSDIRQVRFEDGFSDRVMAAVADTAGLFGTIVSFGRWWVAASLICAAVVGYHLADAAHRSGETLSVLEQQYNEISTSTWGDLL